MTTIVILDPSDGHDNISQKEIIESERCDAGIDSRWPDMIMSMGQPLTITPRDLNDRLIGAPLSLVVDVRTKAEFEGLRASVARNIPLDEISVDTLTNNPPFSKDHPVYLLCERGGRAAIAAGQFMSAGFDDVFVVEGGTRAWIDADLPVIRGERRSISIERQVRIGAGSLVLIGVILGFFVHGAFFGLSAFVGAGLVFAGITDWCGMGLLLTRAPWNR